MRRAVSTAYYAIFHLIVEDFVEHWEFEDQRARLIVPTDVKDAITFAEDTFGKWRSIRGDDIARHHLLSMFGANR